jgi:hypothetical protein
MDYSSISAGDSEDDYSAGEVSHLCLAISSVRVNTVDYVVYEFDVVSVRT